MSAYDLSLILPCYNEGPTFEDNVKRIILELKKTKYKWQLIFVEDKSSDDTKNVIQNIVRKGDNCEAIFHKVNEGRGKAVMDGIKAAESPICGFIDVDCEISPSYISLFAKEVQRGTDLVVGHRFYEKRLKSISRVVATRVYAILVRTLLGLPIEDTEAGCKFFNRKKILTVLPKVNDYKWFWDTEICARSCWEGLKVSDVPVLFIRRLDKKSTVNLVSDSLDYFIKLIKFSLKFRKTRYNASR